MKIVIQLVAASLLSMGVAGGPFYAQAQDKPAAPEKDEAKMDPKGVPGSPSTQGGKAPAEASGSSTGSSSGSASDNASGASGPGTDRAAKSGEEVTMSRDESKSDAKGIPGSPTTQSGQQPKSSQ
jgi:hypothetical protein